MEFVRLPRIDSEAHVVQVPEPTEAPHLESPTRPWDLTKQPSLWSAAALRKLFGKK